MKGTIYRIISISHPEIQYVGSTGNTMAKRWYQHKRDFNLWKKGLSKIKLAIYPYMMEYGFDDFQIMKIKEYEVADKQELSSYEQLYINRIKNVNKNNPWAVSVRTCKWMKKEYDRLHHTENRQKNIDNANAWALNNQVRRRAWCIEQHLCGCGRMVKNQTKAMHKKTDVHKSNLN